jgi:hypothetical protein
MSLIEKRSPFGMYQSLPRRVKATAETLTGSLEELSRGLEVLLPPARAEGAHDLVWIARDLLAPGRPQHLGDLLPDRRVVRPDDLLAGVDLERGQPILQRRVVVVRMRARRRDLDRRDRRRAAIGGH